MALIAWVVIFTTVVLFLAWPLFKPRRAFDAPSGGEGSELLARKGEIYAALRDLEFDYRMGKLSEGDYRELKEKYRLEALALLDQLDKREELGERLEQEVEARRVKWRICPGCGAGRSFEDRFCRKCGASFVMEITRRE